jgi:O-antigen/teichoic acid export membrane protein
MIFARAPIGPLRTRLAGLIGRWSYGVSALDQIALSVFGFALNLVLVRALSAHEYGIVSLWMAMALLSISVQNALVSAPLNVHVNAAPDPATGRRLAAALAVVNLLTIGLATLVVIIVDLTVDAEWAPQDIVTAIAIPVFVAAGMYREYYRSLAFGRNDMAMLLWVDGPYIAVTTLCLVAMFIWPERMASLAGAFLAMSAGCIVSQAFLTGRFAGPRPRPLRRDWLDGYRPVAHDAGWALIGVVTTHLHTRSYVYVTVNLVGLAGLAAINVVGILFRPVRIMLTAWGRTALPELAAHLAAGRLDAFDRMVARAFVLAGVGSGFWLVALLVGWRPIEEHFLAGNYPDAWLLLWPWAVAAAIEAMSSTIAIALQAAREFKLLAYGTVLSAPVTILATIAAVLWQGYTWTLYGVALGNLVLLSVGLARLRRVRRNFLQAPGPAAAPTSNLGPSCEPDRK